MIHYDSEGRVFRLNKVTFIKENRLFTRPDTLFTYNNMNDLKYD